MRERDKLTGIDDDMEANTKGIKLILKGYNMEITWPVISLELQ